jgi:hypothetical protein
VISRTSSSAPANSQKPRAVAGRNVKNPFWSPAYRAVMNTTHTPRRVLAVALLSGGVALAGIGLAADTAQAQTESRPSFMAPSQKTTSRFLIIGAPGNPCRRNDVVWDTNICHTWYWVPVGGMGNVGQFVWDGENPPPHGPPPCYGAPICLPGLQRARRRRRI